MPERSRLLLAFVLSLVLGFYPLLAPPPHHIDQAHFNLIHPGITRADVESLFGVPPGDYDWAEADGPAWPLMFWNEVTFDVTGSTITSRSPLFPQIMTYDIQAPRVQEPQLWLNDRVFWDGTTSLWNPWGVNPPNSTWTSKHGSFTVFFDREARVAAVGGPVGVHLVPPWQRWWRAWRK